MDHVRRSPLPLVVALVLLAPGLAHAAEPASFKVLDWRGSRAAVSWSFDDAQPSHIAHYAELQATGVPMTFYVTTNNADEPGFDETWRRAVNDGHEIGNHSVHHCHVNLAGCTSGHPLGSVDAELDESNRYITTHTPQKEVWTAASPFGDYGYHKADESRFFINRGVPNGMIAPNGPADRFYLPVHAVVTGETAASFEKAIDAARAEGKWVIFLVHTLTPTTANWYAPVAVTEVTAGMRAGRARGDVWNGTVADVGAYWLGQTLLTAAKPVSAPAGTTWSWTLPPHFPPGKTLRITVTGGKPQQNGHPLAPLAGGAYELALDAGSLTIAP
ncbi:MAG TPA: polysaccharide deacetylase family protein [Polyangia bacterium]|nr:polysaccharide deacetylase family protein [Polyangia bacterium]